MYVRLKQYTRLQAKVESNVSVTVVTRHKQQTLGPRSL